MRNRRKTLLRDHSVPEVTLKACLRHYSVSAIPETLTIRGPKRPLINGGESNLRGICSTGRQQVFQFQSIWLTKTKKLVLNRRNIYEYPQEGVSVSRYLIEGTTALNCERKVRRIFSHIGTVHRCWTMCLLNSDHRNRSPWPPI